MTSRRLTCYVFVCVRAGVRLVSVDRKAAGAHERSPSLGRHPAGLPAGVGSHGVRLQPGNPHGLPAHSLGAGTTRKLLHNHMQRH